MSIAPNLKDERLGYTFEKGEYVRIGTESGTSLEYVILVHDIRYRTRSDRESWQLLVTKYSFLPSSFQWQQSPRDCNVALSDRELLLHFEDFDKMGKRNDAEIIRLVDIASATDLTSVDHVVRPPPGRNASRQKLKLIRD